MSDTEFDFPTPTLRRQRKGRSPIGLMVKSLDGKIYVLYSVKRFAKACGFPAESIYALSHGKMASLYGLTMYHGSLEGLVKDVDYFEVRNPEEEA